MGKKKGPTRSAVAVRPGEDPMVARLRVARRQIAGEPGGPLGWLVRFAREDPERWLPGDVEAHGDRLLAVVYGDMPDNLFVWGAGPIPPVMPGSVVEMREELRAWLGQLVSVPAGVPVAVPTKGLEDSLVRMTAPGEKPAMFTTSRGGPRGMLLLQVAKELILRADGRLIACRECGAPTLALRKRLFCSGECGGAWHDREKARKRKEAKGEEARAKATTRRRIVGAR